MGAVFLLCRQVGMAATPEPLELSLRSLHETEKGSGQWQITSH